MSVELGSVIYSAVKPIFKIYFIISLGFYLAKKNILTVSTCRDISDTIVTAILPCLVFENIVTNLKSSDIKNLGIIFFTASLLFLIGIILAYIIHIVTRSPKRWLGGLLSVGLFPNISDLPIAYIQTLSNGGMVFSDSEGSKGVAYICIFLAAQALFQFTLGLYELIAWDFRPELIDEEASTGKEDSDSEQSEPKYDTTINNLNEDKKNNNENKSSNIYDNDYNDDNNENKNKNRNTVNDVPRIFTPEDAESYDDALSISSSIESSNVADVPPPTDIGRTNSQSHVHSLNETISQQLNKRGSRMSRNSISSNAGNSILQPIRSRDLRSLRSQDVNDVINEYSEFDAMRDSQVEKVITAGSDVVGIGLVKSISSNHLTTKQKLKKKSIGMLKNLISPVSFTLILSIAIAMAPPLKALFINSNFDINHAPDGLPPLSFIMDTATYIGNASVPLGLILLGATISRLEIKSMPQGFWKTAVGITLSRLVLLPIIGVGLTTGLYKAGWYGDDNIIRFVSVLEFGLPSATSLVYFTAFYTDPNAKSHLQMDCLAVSLIFQYSILFITLPFLVSFTIKVSLGY